MTLHNVQELILLKMHDGNRQTIESFGRWQHNMQMLNILYTSDKKTDSLKS